MDRELIRKSKKLSWLLRHGATEAGVLMDGAGWASVADVLEATGMTRAELEHVVLHNDKRRLELDGDRVRAVQGHSDGVPVDLDALEASWTAWTGTGSVFHGTYRGALRSIGKQGLVPLARTHVHLIDRKDAVAGKRANVDVLLVIDPSVVKQHGIRLFTAPNGVLLARSVPREAIVDLEPVTRKARDREGELRELLGV
jgi:putative RNA 2'-phosphotransferase